MQKELMKIDSVQFGFGGYQDAQFGLFLTFRAKNIGVATCVLGGWSYSHIKDPERDNCRWSEKDRTERMLEMLKEIDKLLSTAKVGSVEQLKGKPVWVFFEHNIIQSWRLAEEIL